MSLRKFHRVSALLLLLVLVLSVYRQVGGSDFVNIDDDLYVTDNPYVLRGLTWEGLSWAFTTFRTGNWHPLTWISHMLDVELFGPEAAWHHRMNLLFHLLNTELLFLLIYRMTGGFWRSLLAAALFGVHPLNVESAAWIAERKNLLSALFGIAALWAYLGYVRRPGAGRYLLVAAAFVLGLMSKPMLVTLPFALLLLDWWPLGRMTPPGPPSPPGRGRAAVRLAVEKLPLIALSAISCAVTYRAQAWSGTVVDAGRIPIWSRIANALVSYAGYLRRTVWPSSLAVFYPHPASLRAEIPAWEIGGAALLLCGISFLAIREARRRPFLPTGWLWYLGTLVPVIGVVQVGGQALADRYAYLPLIGVFLAVSWGIPGTLSGKHSRILAAGLPAAAVAALSISAWTQAGYWRDSRTLLSRAVAVTESNWFALNGLGNFHYARGEYGEAAAYYREALRIKPDLAAAWNNLGASSRRLGKPNEAIGYLQYALLIRPDLAEAWYNLGRSRSALGQERRAVDSYREALRLRPDYAEARYDLGISLAGLGERRESAVQLREALRLRPDFPEARRALGEAEGTPGDTNGMMKRFLPSGGGR